VLFRRLKPDAFITICMPKEFLSACLLTQVSLCGLSFYRLEEIKNGWWSGRAFSSYSTKLRTASKDMCTLNLALTKLKVEAQRSNWTLIQLHCVLSISES